MQILVLGMHRSGTSLTTRLINMMGVYFAGEGMGVEARSDNPKGFWERKDVIKINQGIIAHIRSKKPMPEAIERDIGRLILRMDAFRPWVLKDPRMCITLDHWLPYFEVPVAVIVWRHPMEIVSSLKTREDMPEAEAFALWEYYAVQLIRSAHTLPKVFTTHAAMLASPVETTRKLYKDLLHCGIQGLRLPSDREILAFVDPKLHHERGTSALTLHQEKICAMLQGNIPFDPELEVSEETQRLTEGKL